MTNFKYLVIIGILIFIIYKMSNRNKENFGTFGIYPNSIRYAAMNLIFNRLYHGSGHHNSKLNGKTLKFNDFKTNKNLYIKSPKEAGYLAILMNQFEHSVYPQAKKNDWNKIKQWIKDENSNRKNFSNSAKYEFSIVPEANNLKVSGEQFK